VRSAFLLVLAHGQSSACVIPNYRCPRAQAREGADGHVSVELHGGAPPLLALLCGEAAGDSSVDFAPLEHSLGSISPPVPSGNTGSEGVEGSGPAGGDTPTSRWGPVACTSGVGAGAGLGQGMAGVGSPGVELVPLGAAGGAGAGRGSEDPGRAGGRPAGGRRRQALSWLARWACWGAPHTEAPGSVRLVGGL
jgi:hypothetical protein